MAATETTEDAVDLAEVDAVDLCVDVVVQEVLWVVVDP